MANDSRDCSTKFEFRSTDAPHGMLFYDLDTLTTEMQFNLTEHKVDMMREDKFFLSEHPEIRAMIAMITKMVLKYHPRKKIHEFLAEYFSRPKFEIDQRLHKYLNPSTTTFFYKSRTSGMSSVDWGLSNSSIFYKVRGSEIRIYKSSDVDLWNENKVIKKTFSGDWDVKSEIEIQKSLMKTSFKDLRVQKRKSGQHLKARVSIVKANVDHTKDKDIKSSSKTLSFMNDVKSEPSTSYFNKMLDFVVDFHGRSATLLPKTNRSINTLLSKLTTVDH